MHTTTTTPLGQTMQTAYSDQVRAAFGPSHVCNIGFIRQSLKMPLLSTEGALSMACDALYHGQSERIHCNEQSYLRMAHNQMVFTFSHDLTTVITIDFAQTTIHMTQTTQTTKTSPMHQEPDQIQCESSPTPSPTPSPAPSSYTAVSLGGKMVEESILDEIMEMDEFIENNEVSRGYRSVTPSAVTPSPSLGNNSWGTMSQITTHVPIVNVAPPPPLQCIPSIEEVNHFVTVPTALFVQLRNRFPNQWGCIADLMHSVERVITSSPGYDVLDWKMWTSTPFVFVMESNGCCLADVFEERYFRQHYEHCLRSLALRRTPTTPPMQMMNTVAASGYDSARSLMGTPPPRQQQQQKRVYHLIYIKPIMERLEAVTGCSVSEQFVTQIVDNAIQCGARRQISKRTFEFKWQRYTVIMSKSLKTILDVAFQPVDGGNNEVISVHPDVVSILAKRCPVLDYFTIQKLAAGAKQTARFSSKKNEYRQQFTYEFAGCRVVFASNHSTIVEMQCSDSSALRALTH